MTPEDRRKLGLLIFILLPVLFWFEVVRRTEVLPPKKGPALWELMKQTPDKPILIMALVGGIVVAILLIWLMNELGKSDFGGAPFKRFLRGTKLVSKDKLKRMTREKKVQQVCLTGTEETSTSEEEDGPRKDKYPSVTTFESLQTSGTC